MKKGIFIDGKYVDAKNQYTVYSPFSEIKLSEVALSNAEEMRAAIRSAQRGFHKIRKLPAHERANILLRAAHMYQERKEEVAQTICQEAAKPIVAARMEVERTIQTLKFSGEEAKRIGGETIPLDAAIGGEGRYAFTVRQPLGVIGAITPFNFPLNLVVHKVGPALAAGNSIIVKPAEQTPLSSFLLAEILTEAGAPEGAVNIVPGEGEILGKVLLESEHVNKISFTGSPEVGKHIKSLAGLKKVTLELGSNSAVYVDRSVRHRLTDIVAQVASGAFSYSGQVCISTQRVYVHQDLFDDFSEKFIVEVDAMHVGDPTDERTTVSAMINSASIERVLSWIEEAKADGARVLTGGYQEGNGIKPTVLTDVTPDMKVSANEVFGPVVILQPVRDSKEALTMMNRSRYGLNAGVFTNDLAQALEMSTCLEVGQVLINDTPTLRFDHMPYGGRKDSGYGREGIKYAIEEMTELKMISLNFSL